MTIIVWRCRFPYKYSLKDWLKSDLRFSQSKKTFTISFIDLSSFSISSLLSSPSLTTFILFMDQTFPKGVNLIMSPPIREEKGLMDDQSLSFYNALSCLWLSRDQEKGRDENKGPISRCDGWWSPAGEWRQCSPLFTCSLIGFPPPPAEWHNSSILHSPLSVIHHCVRFFSIPFLRQTLQAIFQTISVVTLHSHRSSWPHPPPLLALFLFSQLSVSSFRCATLSWLFLSRSVLSSRFSLIAWYLFLS